MQSLRMGEVGVEVNLCFGESRSCISEETRKVRTGQRSGFLTDCVNFDQTVRRYSLVLVLNGGSGNNSFSLIENTEHNYLYRGIELRDLPLFLRTHEEKTPGSNIFLLAQVTSEMNSILPPAFRMVHRMHENQRLRTGYLRCSSQIYRERQKKF